MEPAFLQCSLQYLPYGLFGGTVQVQGACAHGAG